MRGRTKSPSYRQGAGRANLGGSPKAIEAPVTAGRFELLGRRNASVKNFRELKFWDRAHKLVVRVYELTRAFPKEELVNLTATMRRTAMNVTSPLVEGMAIGGERESASLVQNAIGASGLLEYQILLARDLGYLDETGYDELTVELLELRRQLQSHMVKLKSLR
jgi:four helix bundle protein